jgi:hypothetical protein
MPAKSLEDVIAGLSAQEKTLFENTLKNNPELKDGWLRQDDYSRKQTELAAEKTKYDEALAYNVKMEAWAEANVPRWEGLVEKGIVDEDGNELWTAKEAELQRQLSEARAQALGGEDMDPAKLKENVQAILKEVGQVTKQELDALIASETKKLTEATFEAKYAEKEVSFNEKTIPFVTGFSTSMALAAAKYERETGKEFTDDDTKAVFALMARDNNFDPRKMVEEYAKPAKEAKQRDAEFEAKVQAEVQKRTGGMNRGLPGGGDEPFIPQPNQKGALQQMLERSSATEGDVESAVTAAAVKASQELRAEGKAF